MRIGKKHNKTDLELINLYKKRKDPELMGELYKRYTGFIYAISMKYLKQEDACNDAVMGIFEELFDKLLIHDIHNFKSWLHTLTRNYCLLQIRSKGYADKKTHLFEKEQTNFMEDKIGLHQESILLENQLQLLEKCIPKLKEEQRICVDLFYIKQKSYNDISEETGYDLKKVKSYIQNGKRNLKIMMEEKHEQ